MRIKLLTWLSNCKMPYQLRFFSFGLWYSLSFIDGGSNISYVVSIDCSWIGFTAAMLRVGYRDYIKG